LNQGKIMGITVSSRKSGFWCGKSIAKEPMVILLLANVLHYLYSGKTDDGIFMVSRLLGGGISLFQDSRAECAEKLKDLPTRL